MKITQISLPTIFGMKTVNSFVVKGEEIVLFDSGEDTDESYEQLVAGLKSDGLSITDIDRIIITHAHVDHIGMAERVAQAANAKVWVSEKCQAFALDPTGQWAIRRNMILGTIMSFFPVDMHEYVETNYLSFSIKMKDVWKPIRASSIELFDSEGPIEICGETWDALYMPGHSNSQSAFYHASSGSFIAADMLLKIASTPVIEPSPTDPTVREKGILTMMESYDRLSEYDLKTVYPGHYDIFEDGNRMIDKHKDRIDQRVEQCYAIIKSKAPNPISFLDLFQELYKGRWNFPALVMQIGYLDLLEDQGKIAYDESDGRQIVIS